MPKSARHPVTLAAPRLADRERVWQWMCAPGIVQNMMRPPVFADHPVPTFAEFCDDWLPHYFTHEAPTRGRLFLVMEATGIMVDGIPLRDRVCLDIRLPG